MGEILCSHCGVKVEKTSRYISKYTGNSYCKDLTACHRRADKAITAASNKQGGTSIK